MVLTGPCWPLSALCSLYQHRHVSSCTGTKADRPIVNSCLRDHPERSRECQREDRISGAVQGPTHSPGKSWRRSDSELRDCSLCVRALLGAKRRTRRGRSRNKTRVVRTPIEPFSSSGPSKAKTERGPPAFHPEKKVDDWGRFWGWRRSSGSAVWVARR